MRAQRTIQSIAPVLLLAMVFLFGTQEVNAATYTWKTTVPSGDWNVDGNWESSDGGTTFPGSGDKAIFGSPATVTITAAQSVDIVEITGCTVNFTSNVALTVSNTMTLNDAVLQLQYTASRTSSILIIDGMLELLATSSGSKIEYAGTIATEVYITLSATSSLRMGDLRTCYIGNSTPVSARQNINTRLGRAAGQFVSDVHFEGNVVLDTRVNLGEYNVWFGKYAGNIRTGNGSNITCFTFTDQHNYNPSTTIGRVIKSAEYWKSGGNWDATVGYFVFETGYDTQQGNYWLGIDLNYVVEASWGATASEPFRGVSVRYVYMKHPQNQATGNKVVLKYWVIQPVGYEQVVNPYFPPYPQVHNDICYAVEFNTSDVNAPQEAYAAIYSDNYEQVEAGGAWYNYGSLPGGNSTANPGRLYCEICPTYYFGDITIAEGSNPVPVELTSFSARYVRDNVELKWQTATELNNYGFAIERSRDGETWEEIDFVAGAGNSFSPRSYTYTDILGRNEKAAPKLGYRLRQIDRDGTTEYSNVVFVNIGALPSGVKLYEAYPNPFNPSTTVSFSLDAAAPVKVRVYDIYGREVATLLDNAALDAGVHTVAFRASALPSGSYIVVLNAAGVTRHQRVVLNK